MKPASFEYVRPDSVEHAVEELARHGGEARPLAGGQTLGPMLNLRLALPSCLVDLGGIGALKRIERRGDRIIIGSGVTHAAIEDGAVAAQAGLLLSEVASGIAYRAIRNRGTIGGSLAHADPSADWITTMSLLDACVRIAGPSGRREVAMPDFMSGAFTTAIGPSDILTEIEIADLSPSARWGYYRVCRKAGEFPDAVGAVLLDPDRALSRVVVGALDGKPAFLLGLADRVAREGAACATAEIIEAAIREVAPGLDDVDLQLHRAAVRRAILLAVSG